MKYSLKLVTGPTSEPVTLIEAKQQCRVDLDFLDDDAYLNSLIASARSHVQHYTRRQLLPATWDLFLPSFPGNQIYRRKYFIDSATDFLYLPFSPLASVSWVKYYDTDGTLITLTVDTDYKVDINNEPGLVCPAYGMTWPSAQDMPNSVNVRYINGYANAAAVPDDIKHAMKMLIGHWYRNREAVITGTIASELPRTVKSVLNAVKVVDFEAM